MTVEISKTNLYIGEGDPSPSGVRVSKTNLYITGNTGIYSLFVTFPAGSSDPGDQLYLAEFDSQAPDIVVRDMERNPYRAHMADDPVEQQRDLKEQQRVLREQHNKTQAGDTTFDYGLLLKTYPNKEFTLGSLGRFFHDDYGLILARFVQFNSMAAHDWQGQPCGRRKFNTTGVDWIVTNDFDKSDPALIMGICFTATIPEDDTYGWLVVAGPNPAAIRAVGSGIAERNDPYTWVATGGIGLDASGTILGRRWQSADAIGIPAGSLFVRIEGRSDTDLQAAVEEWFADTFEQVEAHEERLDLLEAWKIAATADLAALEAADNVLTLRIAREELIRAREIQALRTQFVVVDFETYINDLRVEITEAYTLADQPGFTLATTAYNLVTALQLVVDGIDLSGLSALTGIATSMAAIDAKFDGIVFDNTPIATADQVFITTLVTNSDGNDQVVMVPIDYKIIKLKDFDNTSPASANNHAVVWDTGLSKYIPRAVVLPARTITAGTGLTGGGDLSADRTITLANTAVTPGTYGDATHSAQIAIDAQGRITSASSITISGGGGATVWGANSGTGVNNGLIAGRGALVVPFSAIDITSVYFQVNPPSVSAAYQAYVVELDSGNTITAIIETSSAQVPGSTTVNQMLVFPLLSVVTLNAGTRYAIMLYRNDATGTTSSGSHGGDGDATAFPIQPLDTYMRQTTTLPTVGDVLTSAANPYHYGIYGSA